MSTKDRIQILIEQTGDAYAIFAENHQANTDYADFAAQALAEFREALDAPDMSYHKLSQILRRGSYQHRLTGDEHNWSSYLASYVRDASNRRPVLK